MSWQVEVTLFVLMIVAALVALRSRDLLAAAVTLSFFSFMTAVIMVSLGAIDVAFTEAVVGAGAVGGFNIVASAMTTRERRD